MMMGMKSVIPAFIDTSSQQIIYEPTPTNL